MSQQNIDFGSFPNDPSADPIRAAFSKVQNNFTELYTTQMSTGVTSLSVGPGLTQNRETGNVTIRTSFPTITIDTTSSNNSILVGVNSPTSNTATITNSNAHFSLSLAPTITTNAAVFVDTTTGNLAVTEVVTDLIPNVDVTLDLGSDTNRWNNLYLSGNLISFGDTDLTSDGDAVHIPNVIVSGNVTANVVIANLLTGTLTTNAQPNVTSLGTLTGLTLSGNIVGTNSLFSGNVNSNNMTVTETVTANLYNGTFDGNIVAPGSNRQVVFNDNGFDNATAGLTFNKTSNVLTVAANVSTGNLIASGTLAVTGNANTGNLGTTNIVATGNLAVVGVSASGNLAVTGNVTSGNLQTSGNLTVVGNVTMTNITSVNIINGNTVTMAGNVSSANLLASQNLTVTGTGTVGNLVNNGNLTVSGDADITGDVSGNNASFVGNVSGFNSSLSGNISVGSNISGANLSLTGIATALGTGTFGNVVTTGNVSAAGNASITGNVSGGNLFSSGNVTVAQDVIAAGDAFISGNTNIIGDLISGNITTDEINATGNITGNIVFGALFSGNGANLTRVTGANVTGIVPNANYSAYAGNANTSNTAITVTGASQPNITLVGSLTELTVSGDTELAGNLLISRTMTITAGNIMLTGNASISGTISGSNISAVNVNAVGSISAANISATLFTGSGANLTNINGSNVSNIVPNANYAAYSGNANTSNTAITVTGSAQSNITSVGTLTGLTVNGNTSTQNLTLSGYTFLSVSSSVAAAGSTQGTATVLAKEISVVTTMTPTTASGVRLPDAITGMAVTVINVSSGTINVYPGVGASIDSITTNNPFPLGAGARLQFVATSSAKWYSLTAVFG